MGVWEQTGNRTYKLKHVALAYASSDTPPALGGPVSPAVFVGAAIIRETVTLSRSGDSFEGTFTLDQYARDETTLLQQRHKAGTLGHILRHFFLYTEAEKIPLPYIPPTYYS